LAAHHDDADGAVGGGTVSGGEDLAGMQRCALSENQSTTEERGTDVKLTGRLGLEAIDQVAYAVENMDRARARYEPIFGPFEVAESNMKGCTVRGRSADVRLLWAVNRSGPIEVELIQPLAGELTITEHLRTSQDLARMNRPRPFGPSVNRARRGCATRPGRP
jgi:hypothetical protein